MFSIPFSKYLKFSKRKEGSCSPLNGNLKELPISEEFCDAFHKASLESMKKMKKGIKPRFIKLA